MSEEVAQDTFFSVSDAVSLVQHAFGSIGTLEVVGEVSEASSPNRSGHVYATIKDDKTVLSLAIFRNVYAHVGLALKVGDQIKVKGYFSYYEPTGRTSFIVVDYSYFGEGHLRAQIEALKKKLELEGLFSPAAKKAVPAFAERVVCVTSPTGAVIEDVRRTLKRRNPLVKLGFVGCAVQGKDAPSSIVSALQKADATAADVVLLVRGGGSLEDLMPFNSEEVVRAIAVLEKPIVTGIGHEPDTTLADYAADMRASTPTAAAESIAPTTEELEAHLSQLKQRIELAVAHELTLSEDAVRHMQNEMHTALVLYLAKLESNLSQLANHPELKRPDSWIEIRANKLILTEERLQTAMNTLLMHYDSHIARANTTLQALSPKNVLKRGYALLSTEKGVLTSATRVKAGDRVRIELQDGLLRSTIDAVERN